MDDVLILGDEYTLTDISRTVKSKDYFFLAKSIFGISKKFRKDGMIETIKYIEKKHKIQEISESVFEEDYLFMRRMTSICNIFLRVLSPNALCLEKSLVLWGVSRFLGVKCNLVIGRQMYRTNALHDFHAWVEHRNQPINSLAGITSYYIIIYKY